MMLFIAKVTWYDKENHPGPATDNVVIAAESHSCAAAQLEDFFGEGIETIDITLINPNCPIALIDDETYDGIQRSEI